MIDIFENNKMLFIAPFTILRSLPDRETFFPCKKIDLFMRLSMAIAIPSLQMYVMKVILIHSDGGHPYHLLHHHQYGDEFRFCQTPGRLLSCHETNNSFRVFAAINTVSDPYSVKTPDRVLLIYFSFTFFLKGKLSVAKGR